MSGRPDGTMRLSSVEFDCETRRERNQRGASIGAVMALAARVKEQKRRTAEALAKLGSPPGMWFTPPGAAPSFTRPNRIEVTLFRVGPGSLDNDGPDDALKNVRDAVAAWLGIDDRDGGGALWRRGAQEKTPGTSTQGPCSVCFVTSGQPCSRVDVMIGGAPAPRVKGLHAARRTPWRVRIEVRDLTPGPDRVLVLASVEPQKRKKAKPRPPKQNAPEGSEDHSARMLVACSHHGAPAGVPCGSRFKKHGGVCPARAARAGIAPSLAFRDVALLLAGGAPGGDELVRSMPPKPPGPRRIVGPPVVRVALPWWQPTCGECDGDAIVRDPAPDAPGARPSYACDRCKGRGIVGPLALSIDPAVDARAASVTYRVPAAHVARWGAQVTLTPRRYRVAALGVVTVFELKGPRR